MNRNQSITREYFIKRLNDLCLRSGLSGFPNDYADQHILFKSAALSLGISVFKKGALDIAQWSTNICRWLEVYKDELSSELVRLY